MTEANFEAARTELAALLDELVTACTLRTVVIVTKNGSLVTNRGDVTYLDVTALAALLGAMFSATREVARMVGEAHFSLLLQQGEKRHIHISLLANEFMLGCIFEDVGKIGMLRNHTRRVATRLGELAAVAWVPSTSPVASATDLGVRPQPEKETEQFREYALDLIDRIFSS